MSIETNLNTSPYFDDFDEAKEFYKILFKPSVSVQVRELNQLQSILQNQIERFGNHVFKNGTIINGVNFEYLPFYPYVKIRDINTAGQPVDIETYANYWVKNSANLVAKVINYKTGIESRDPDLNTLYLRYLNSGSSCTAQSYANSDVLTVFSIDYPIFSITVNNGGSNFSNSDTVVFMSALSVNVASGTFSNGETITQANTGAQAQILEVNTTAIADTTILKVKPLNADLSNTSANSAEWTFNTGYNVTGGTSGAVANVVSLIGSGAAGEIVTDSLGVVTSIQITAGGEDYTITPHTCIKPESGSASVSTLNVQSLNYLTNITVANSSYTAPVGNGYAFAVTDGIIYQKGHFLRVDPQVVIVDKYSGTPNNAVVGFDTAETIVTSTADTSLLDNATGAPNETAPGANRLKLTPVLDVLTKEQSDANTSFLPLVEFVEGNPYKENRVTVYNTLAKEFERRTHESAGDYVVDPFSVSTKDLVISTSNSSPNTTHFQVIVDPGVAYISGSRVETLRNTIINVPKGLGSRIREDQLVTASYGSYVIVKELAGSFNVAAGASISLRDTAAQALTNTTSFSISAPGSEIGTARIRSVVYNSGVAGSPNGLFEVYLFDIQMNQGKNFRDVRSIYYGGTVKGVADINLELDATLNTSVAVLKQPLDKKIVFDTGYGAVKVVNNAIYQYKTTNESLSVNTASAIAISLTTSGESFPYTPSSDLTASQKEDIILVPTANLQAAANLSGSVSFSGSLMTGSGTSFINDLRVGDYVKVANATTSEIFSISSIANNTSARVLTAPATMSTGNVVLFFPALRPLNFTTRDTRTISLSANSTVLTANLNTTLTGTGTISGTYVVRNTGDSQVSRTVYRDCYVKLRLANNAGSTTGPWSLGVPDVIRLKNVYLGNSSVTSSYPDVTKNFFVDTGQTPDAYKLSSLVKQNRSSLVLDSADYLLVRFDLLEHSASGGFNTISSFSGSIDDTKTLADSTNTINTVEIPFNLRNSVDFRPVVANTAAITNTAASATINPSNTNTFDSASKYFPVPDSEFTYTIEYYQGRQDRVIVNKNGNFEVIQGMYGGKKPPETPTEAMSLSVLSVPPYPSIGSIASNTISQFMTSLVGDSIRTVSSVKQYIVQSDNTLAAGNMQPVQYTMKDIVSLENRIKALEYQASFNALENDVNQQNIPSSLDATLPRFKNGFFVDSFVDNAKADQSNKEFSATIDFERGELQPAQRHVNLQMKFDRTDATTNNAIINGTVLMLPFTEQTLISQPKVTSYINSDGSRTQFIGSTTITPPTFVVEGQMEKSVVINLDYIDIGTMYTYDGGSDDDSA